MLRNNTSPSKIYKYGLIDFIFDKHHDKAQLLSEIKVYSTITSRSINVYEIISLVEEPEYSITDMYVNHEYFQHKLLSEPIDILKLFVYPDKIEFMKLTWDDYYMTVPYKGYNIRIFMNEVKQLLSISGANKARDSQPWNSYVLDSYKKINFVSKAIVNICDIKVSLMNNEFKLSEEYFSYIIQEIKTALAIYYGNTTFSDTIKYFMQSIENILGNKGDYWNNIKVYKSDLSDENTRERMRKEVSEYYITEIRFILTIYGLCNGLSDTQISDLETHKELMPYVENEETIMMDYNKFHDLLDELDETDIESNFIELVSGLHIGTMAQRSMTEYIEDMLVITRYRKDTGMSYIINNHDNINRIKLQNIGDRHYIELTKTDKDKSLRFKWNSTNVMKDFYEHIDNMSDEDFLRLILAKDVKFDDQYSQSNINNVLHKYIEKFSNKDSVSLYNRITAYFIMMLTDDLDMKHELYDDAILNVILSDTDKNDICISDIYDDILSKFANDKSFSSEVSYILYSIYKEYDYYTGHIIDYNDERNAFSLIQFSPYKAITKNKKNSKITQSFDINIKYLTPDINTIFLYCIYQFIGKVINRIYKFNYTAINDNDDIKKEYDNIIKTDVNKWYCDMSSILDDIMNTIHCGLFTDKYLIENSKYSEYNNYSLYDKYIYAVLIGKLRLGKVI